MQTDPEKNFKVLHRRWIPALMVTGRYDDAASLALDAIFAQPQAADQVQLLLISRIDALIALGKTQEALACAKSLYNVCTMDGTAEAISRVAECLKLAHPDDPMIADRFRQEQQAAATNAGDSSRSPILDAIHVDPAPYEQALSWISGDDYISLLKRGNLLLVMDRLKEARIYLEWAYGKHPDDARSQATESLARLMRAEDGTIARANMFLRSLAPQEHEKAAAYRQELIARWAKP